MTAFRSRGLAVLFTVALGASSLDAGVNYSNNHGTYPSVLRSERWGVAISGLDPRRGDGPPVVVSPDAKQLVVQAVKDMPGAADRVPLKAREELARIAAEVFNKGGELVDKNTIGNVEYKIGYYGFTVRQVPPHSIKAEYPFDGKRSMPFVAVRIVDEPTGER